MMRKTAFTLILSLIIAAQVLAQKALSPSQGTIEAYVTKLNTSKKSGILVSSGIPFAPGMVFSDKDIAVLDIDGNEIAIAAKALARWPQDNSLRSVLVQFPMAIPRKYEMILIRWGKPRATKALQLTDVNRQLPQGFILLPAKWLCASNVIGAQAPLNSRFLSQYDWNIEKYYPRMRDAKLKGDAAEDFYYDTAHVFYQLYAQTGDDDYFKSARSEALRYRDGIIKTGPQRGRHIASNKTRYIYVEAMIDDYFFTGDPESLKMAGYMAEYLKNNFKPSDAFFPKDSQRFWTEREAAFPLIGIVSYYELTGDKEYLKAAREIMENLYKTQEQFPGRGGFIHNLYSHDPEEGARPDEYGGSPFMTGLLLEAIVKYHQLTNSDIAKDSIFKALDWLINEGLSPEGDAVVYMTSDKGRRSSHPDLNMLVVHAFGYGYKISGYTRTDYLECGKRLFNRGAKEAYLGDRKHFNQNYRSSGHFLAYIDQGEIPSPRCKVRKLGQFRLALRRKSLSTFGKKFLIVCSQNLSSTMG